MVRGQSFSPPSKEENYRKVFSLVFHDSVRPQAAAQSRETHWELKCKALDYPTYSTNLSPSDFHLLESLQMAKRRWLICRCWWGEENAALSPDIVCFWWDQKACRPLDSTRSDAGDYVGSATPVTCGGGRGKEERKLFELPTEKFPPEVLNLLICYPYRKRCFASMLPLLKSSYYNLGHRTSIS